MGSSDRPVVQPARDAGEAARVAAGADRVRGRWVYGIVDDPRELCEECSALLQPASAFANARERACATVNAMLAGAQ
jgi:hypothetical protein